MELEESKEAHPFEDDIIEANINHHESHKSVSGKHESPAPATNPFEILTSEQTQGKGERIKLYSH